jgi:hypothetical protein
MIGILRRELLDQLLIISEHHLHQVRRKPVLGGLTSEYQAVA